jgi:hypothetical protein
MNQRTGSRLGFVICLVVFALVPAICSHEPTVRSCRQ